MDLHTAFETTKNFDFQEEYHNFQIFDSKGFSGRYIPYFKTHSSFEVEYLPDYSKLKQSPFNKSQFIIEDKNAFSGMYSNVSEKDKFITILNHYAFSLNLPNKNTSTIKAYVMEHDHKDICWDGETPVIYIFSIEYEGNKRYFYEAMMSDGPIEYSQDHFEQFLDHYHLTNVKENLIFSKRKPQLK